MSEARGDGSNGSGSTTAPVYLRMHKRAQTDPRRASSMRERARMRSLSLIYLVLLFGACGLWFLVRYVDSSPRFQLHAVELTGGQYVSQAAVESVFEADRQTSIYRIPLEERRRQLEQMPWVHAAAVTRVLPDRVVVNLEERQPVAFLWTRHGIELMDRDGVILESPPDVTWTFPVLRGIPESDQPSKRRQRMTLYLELMEGLQLADGSFPPEISEVDLADPENLSTVVTDRAGALRLQLGDEDLLARYQIYQAHIEEWRQQFSDIRSIDLRFEGQAVIQSASPFTVSVDPEPVAKPRAEKGAAPPSQQPPASAAAVQPLTP